MTSGAGAAGHSLAFRVMRLCRPSCQVDHPLLVDPSDVCNGEDSVNFKELLPGLVNGNDPGFWKRFELQEPMDAMGLSGQLVLPQTFGSIYLGETFCSYISVGNHTNHDVRDVIIKAELQTERQRIILSDNSKSPIESIRATGRFDFIIEHDIKELGGHTLVCMAVYTDPDGDRKYLPQYFKFTTSNPVSVRTKVFDLYDTTFLEACIENQTKSHLFMDQVRFEPAPPWSVTTLENEEEASESDGPISGYIKSLKLINGNGGARHYLFQLKRPPLESSDVKLEGANALGKLEILWRTTLGETGRLQTQQINGSPTPKKPLDVKMTNLPQRILIERPFLVRMEVTNRSEQFTGPLRVVMSETDDNGTPRTVLMNGLLSLMVPPLAPLASTELEVNLVAVAAGVQRVAGICLVDARDGRQVEFVPPTEVNFEALLFVANRSH
ncbi:hypothetical protein SELMODRAFT_76214 [Selaginella moellendorffii]|uniref:Trafficking protein particle complex subunit 13 n=1 Tax=Selaginella moellendorffii TaxID=88036 RepID=D8QRZ8_SELML|nr:hypothetical protein SELMODRAFT_76214 [Selaginella moellendorffii]